MANDYAPLWHDGAVTARCPNCDGARTRFKPLAENGASIIRSEEWTDGAMRVSYHLAECLGCGRGGLIIMGQMDEHGWRLLDFYPRSPDFADLPVGVPPDLENELREAERAAGAGAYRAASATLRSALEKTLKANGYAKGLLQGKIDEAADDGVITRARQARAHESVRALGNDIVHDDWRCVDAAEFEESRQYVVWILRDLYDDRETVLKQLRSAGRLPPLEA